MLELLHFFHIIRRKDVCWADAPSGERLSHQPHYCGARLCRRSTCFRLPPIRSCPLIWDHYVLWRWPGNRRRCELVVVFVTAPSFFEVGEASSYRLLRGVMWPCRFASSKLSPRDMRYALLQSQMLLNMRLRRLLLAAALYLRHA